MGLERNTRPSKYEMSAARGRIRYNIDLRKRLAENDRRWEIFDTVNKPQAPAEGNVPTDPRMAVDEVADVASSVANGLATNSFGPLTRGPQPTPTQPNNYMQQLVASQERVAQAQADAYARLGQAKSKIVSKDMSGNVIQQGQPRGLDAYYANNPGLAPTNQQRKAAFNLGMGNSNKNLHR